MDESELFKRLSDLDADVRVVVVRLEGHDDRLSELGEEHKWLRRMIITTLATAVLTLVSVLISLGATGG